MRAGLSGVLALTTIGLGVALLAVTIAHGGGETGIIIGVLFVLVGAGRIFLARRT